MSGFSIAWLCTGGACALVGGVAAAVFSQRRHRRDAHAIEQLEILCAQARAVADRAERATASKGEFLANMSHEIRTPLNSMIGITELLLESELNPHQKFQLNTVVNSAETLLRIINDILDFSKIESGTLALEVNAFSPRQLAQETLVMLAPRVREKNRRHKMELLMALDPALPETMIGDAARIRQILTNLVSNAVKFTNKGHVSLRMAPYPLPNGSHGLRCIVHDSGIGIANDKRERIFSKFVQAEGTRTAQQFGGTGLGLAICRQLVTLMGGTIDVTSRENEGSAFTVELPLRTVPATPALAATHLFAGRRALLVDDSPPSAELLKTIVGSFGIRCFMADDLQSAISNLQTAGEAAMPIDYLFVEHRLADVPAGQLLQWMQHARLAPMPCAIGMALSDEPHLAHAFQQAGGQAFLRKPLFEEHIRRLLAMLEQQPNHFVDSALFHDDGAVPTATGYPDYNRWRVLLVEDNRVNRELAIEILAKFRITADFAENGLDAVNLLTEKTYDLVLMDCQMPVMDGFEATRRIRNQASERNCVPIIALTANAMRGDRERCLQAGMDDYLSKPIRLQDMRLMLKRWFEPTAAAPLLEHVA